MSEDLIENKIAKSGLITFDLESLYTPGPRVHLDISPWLWQKMVIKEKEFKNHIQNYDWEQYKDKMVAFSCEADAIVPNWAYMMIAAKLKGNATFYRLGSIDQLNELLLMTKINELNIAQFEGKRVLVKGCSDKAVPASAYVALSQCLLPHVKALMFGEACSNVPIYKSKSSNT